MAKENSNKYIFAKHQIILTNYVKHIISMTIELNGLIIKLLTKIIHQSYT